MNFTTINIGPFSEADSSGVEEPAAGRGRNRSRRSVCDSAEEFLHEHLLPISVRDVGGRAAKWCRVVLPPRSTLPHRSAVAGLDGARGIPTPKGELPIGSPPFRAGLSLPKPARITPQAQLRESPQTDNEGLTWNELDAVTASWADGSARAVIRPTVESRTTRCAAKTLC